MTDHEEQLRERVRAWKEREHAGRGGLSRAAEALGVSHAMLSEYLNGRRSAKGELLAKGIAKVLGISLDEVHGLPQRTIVPDTTQPIFANVEGWEVGLTVRPGALPPGTPGMLVGRTIVYCARTRARGLVILHELAHYLLRDRQHTHGDVVALPLVLALPDPVLRLALAVCGLTTEACMARQPWVPRWVVDERIVLAAPQLRPVGETG